MKIVQRLPSHFSFLAVSVCLRLTSDAFSIPHIMFIAYISMFTDFSIPFPRCSHSSSLFDSKNELSLTKLSSLVWYSSLWFYFPLFRNGHRMFRRRQPIHNWATLCADSPLTLIITFKDIFMVSSCNECVYHSQWFWMKKLLPFTITFSSHFASFPMIFHSNSMEGRITTENILKLNTSAVEIQMIFLPKEISLRHESDEFPRSRYPFPFLLLCWCLLIVVSACLWAC